MPDDDLEQFSEEFEKLSKSDPRKWRVTTEKMENEERDFVRAPYMQNRICCQVFFSSSATSSMASTKLHDAALGFRSGFLCLHGEALGSLIHVRVLVQRWESSEGHLSEARDMSLRCFYSALPCGKSAALVFGEDELHFLFTFLCHESILYEALSPVERMTVIATGRGVPS